MSWTLVLQTIWHYVLPICTELSAFAGVYGAGRYYQLSHPQDSIPLFPTVSWSTSSLVGGYPTLSFFKISPTIPTIHTSTNSMTTSEFEAESIVHVLLDTGAAESPPQDESCAGSDETAEEVLPEDTTVDIERDLIVYGVDKEEQTMPDEQSVVVTDISLLMALKLLMLACLTSTILLSPMIGITWYFYSRKDSRSNTRITRLEKQNRTCKAAWLAGFRSREAIKSKLSDTQDSAQKKTMEVEMAHEQDMETKTDDLYAAQDEHERILTQRENQFEDHLNLVRDAYERRIDDISDSVKQEVIATQRDIAYERSLRVESEMKLHILEAGSAQIGPALINVIKKAFVALLAEKSAAKVTSRQFEDSRAETRRVKEELRLSKEETTQARSAKDVIDLELTTLRTQLVEREAEMVRERETRAEMHSGVQARLDRLRLRYDEIAEKKAEAEEELVALKRSIVDSDTAANATQLADVLGAGGSSNSRSWPQSASGVAVDINEDEEEDDLVITTDESGLDVPPEGEKLSLNRTESALPTQPTLPPPTREVEEAQLPSAQSEEVANQEQDSASIVSGPPSTSDTTEKPALTDPQQSNSVGSQAVEARNKDEVPTTDLAVPARDQTSASTTISPDADQKDKIEPQSAAPREDEPQGELKTPDAKSTVQLDVGETTRAVTISQQQSDHIQKAQGNPAMASVSDIPETKASNHEQSLPSNQDTNLVDRGSIAEHNEAPALPRKTLPIPTRRRAALSKPSSSTDSKGSNAPEESAIGTTFVFGTPVVTASLDRTLSNPDSRTFDFHTKATIIVPSSAGKGVQYADDGRAERADGRNKRSFRPDESDKEVELAPSAPLGMKQLREDSSRLSPVPVKKDYGPLDEYGEPTQQEAQSRVDPEDEETDSGGTQAGATAPSELGGLEERQEDATTSIVDTTSEEISQPADDGQSMDDDNVQTPSTVPKLDDVAEAQNGEGPGDKDDNPRVPDTDMSDNLNGGSATNTEAALKRCKQSTTRRSIISDIQKTLGQDISVDSSNSPLLKHDSIFLPLPKARDASEDTGEPFMRAKESNKDNSNIFEGTANLKNIPPHPGTLLYQPERATDLAFGKASTTFKSGPQPSASSPNPPNMPMPMLNTPSRVAYASQTPNETMDGKKADHVSIFGISYQTSAVPPVMTPQVSKIDFGVMTKQFESRPQTVSLSTFPLDSSRSSGLDHSNPFSSISSPKDWASPTNVSVADQARNVSPELKQDASRANRVDRNDSVPATPSFATPTANSFRDNVQRLLMPSTPSDNSNSPAIAQQSPFAQKTGVSSPKLSKKEIFNKNLSILMELTGQSKNKAKQLLRNNDSNPDAALANLTRSK